MPSTYAYNQRPAACLYAPRHTTPRIPTPHHAALHHTMQRYTHRRRPPGTQTRPPGASTYCCRSFQKSARPPAAMALTASLYAASPPALTPPLTRGTTYLLMAFIGPQCLSLAGHSRPPSPRRRAFSCSSPLRPPPAADASHSSSPPAYTPRPGSTPQCPGLLTHRGVSLLTAPPCTDGVYLSTAPASLRSFISRRA